MSIQVENEKMHAAKTALKEATTKKKAAAEGEVSAKKAVDDAMDALQKAKAAVTAAADEEKKATERIARCEKSMARVKQQLEDTKAAEEKFGGLFDELDKNKSGTVSHTELKKFLAAKDHTVRLQLGIGRWQEFLDAVDVDGDRQVSRDEWVNYFTMKNLDPIQCWGSLFDAIDTNHDGSLTKIEIRNYSWNENPRVMQLTGFKSWEELVKTIDVDESGTIERDEWLSHFASKEITGQYRPAKKQKV